ncbi:MAG: hypothetical protein P1V97_12545 [Planctomycetota bacterium]|nr:hypothetical protein [Planctomycetota bacterium]
MVVVPLSPSRPSQQNASISVVVPLYIKNAQDSSFLKDQLNTFFTQFHDDLKEKVPFDIFLSDSGQDSKSAARIQQTIDEVLENHSQLIEQVTYHHEPTDGPPLSRSEAMNLGVQRSLGSVLLFLHIDCRLPRGALRDIRDAVSNGAHGGGFTKTYSGKARFSPLHCTEFYLNQMRTIRGRHLVGTNAMFMSRDLALEHPFVGDFLEDVEMSDWMRARLRPGALKIIPKAVTVSARKYQKYGPIPSIAINAAVMILYRLFRVRPSLLKTLLYHRKFPSGLAFWKVWLQTVVSLADRGGKIHGH